MNGDHVHENEEEEPFLVPQPSFLSPPPHFISPLPLLPLPQNYQFTPPNPPSKKPKYTPSSTLTTSTTTDDTASAAVSRRQRGRPPGSKNKLKPIPFITHDPKPKPEPELGPAMSPCTLELPSGSDIIGSLTRFTRRNGVGILVLTATGTIENVTLKQPLTNSSSGFGTVTFHGRFDIISLSACITTNTMPFNGFTITMAGPQGQIIGGKVVGPLHCVGPVYVIAASFNNPSHIRLTLEDVSVSQNHRVTSGNGDGNGDGNGGTHVRMYSGNSSDEALRTPTPLAVRPPPHTK
ncbi:hypothetical protein RND81_06G062300 [Saponaria officinalis]|uniref:PPC domain-containing protein n=1 Tax=Saponaria officinalis TaxID=3572 RepID=A0AAW1K4F5_SAPOF